MENKCVRVSIIMSCIMHVLKVASTTERNGWCKGSFTIVNIYVLVQRVLGGGRGSEASVLFFKC